MKVGELARRTGLTVRTLHHYDDIGILSPTARTPSGHRLYGPEEVERLQTIVSLRHLGFSLDEITRCMGRPGFELEAVVERHLEAIRRRMHHEAQIARRLEGLLERVRSASTDGPVSIDDLLQTVEVTVMYEKYYTPEQLEQLASRRAEVGEAEIEAIQEQWADLIAQVQDLIDRGVDPADPEVRSVASSWRSLTERTVAGFTGGDPGLQESLGRYWSEQPDAGSAWGMGPELRGWIDRAVAALDDG